MSALNVTSQFSKDYPLQFQQDLIYLKSSDKNEDGSTDDYAESSVCCNTKIEIICLIVDNINQFV